MFWVLTGNAPPARGIETGEHCASLNGGRPGVLHGNRTYLMQDADGQIIVDIMNRMGYEQAPYDAATMLEEISQIVPFFKGIKWREPFACFPIGGS